MATAFHKLVEVIKIDVRDERADHPTLRAAIFTRLPSLSDHHPTLQKHPHQIQDTSIRDLSTNAPQDVVMVQGVETL